VLGDDTSNTNDEPIIVVPDFLAREEDVTGDSINILNEKDT
jgi:hypothetical protein